MSSHAKVAHLKLVLVGEPGVGKSSLCRQWSPKFAPQDGYHVYHSYNDIYPTIMNIREPPPAAPDTIDYRAGVGIYIMILQPRQEGDLVKLTPFVMMNTDVVGLCYNSSNRTTLEDAVNKWLPFIKHHLPSTPIVLIGCAEESLPSTPKSGVNAVSPKQLDQAIRQVDAAASVTWSQRPNKPGTQTPSYVAELLAWYGYHHAHHAARSKEQGCVVL